MNTATCRVPHPSYPSITCQKLAGHDGNHHATRRRNGAHHSRIWAPYLSTFTALTRPLVGGRS